MDRKEIFYEPPKIEVIKVAVEGGFAVSGYGNDTENDYDFGERL